MNKILLIVACFFVIQTVFVHSEEYKFYRSKASEEPLFVLVYGSFALGAVNIVAPLSIISALGCLNKKKGQLIGVRAFAQGFASFFSMAYLLALPIYGSIAYLYKHERNFSFTWNRDLEKPLLSFDENGFSYEENVGKPNVYYRWDDVVRAWWMIYPTVPGAKPYRKIFVRGSLGTEKIHINFYGIDMSRDGAENALRLFDKYLSDAGRRNSKNLGFWDKMITDR